MAVSNITNKKRMMGFLVLFVVILFLLLIRIGWIQFIDGGELQLKAYKQQTRDRLISPNRGTIYDSTGEVLARSATVETVTAEPNNIEDEEKEKIAKGISDTLGLEYENVLEKLNKNTSIVTIASKIEKSETDKLRTWLDENDINRGINIDEDTKRFYPFGSVASNIIGFCGTDNQGLEGLEKTYDKILTGISRKNCNFKRCITEEKFLQLQKSILRQKMEITLF